MRVNTQPTFHYFGLWDRLGGFFGSIGALVEEKCPVLIRGADGNTIRIALGKGACRENESSRHHGAALGALGDVFCDAVLGPSSAFL